MRSCTAMPGDWHRSGAGYTPETLLTTFPDTDHPRRSGFAQDATHTGRSLHRNAPPGPNTIMLHHPGALLRRPPVAPDGCSTTVVLLRWSTACSSAHGPWKGP